MKQRGLLHPRVYKTRLRDAEGTETIGCDLCGRIFYSYDETSSLGPALLQVSVSAQIIPSHSLGPLSSKQMTGSRYRVTKQQFTTTKVHFSLDKLLKTKLTRIVNLSEKSRHTRAGMSSAWSSHFTSLGNSTLLSADSV